MNHHRLIGTLVALGLVFSACAAPASPTPAPQSVAPAPTQAPAQPPVGAAKPAAKPAEKTHFTLTRASKVMTPGGAYTWVGAHPDLHFFEDEGIDIEINGTNGAPECLQMLLINRVDSCMLAQDQILMRANEGERLPVKLVYNYTYKITNEFAVRPDSPIKDIKDLAGKKVGVVNLGHDTYIFAQNVFKQLGIDPAKQEYVAVGQGASAVTLLYDGRVDGMVAWDIEWTTYKTLGKPVRVLPQPDFIKAVKAGPTIAVRSEDVTKRPDLIGGMLRAETKSEIFMIENPDATLRMHWDMYPETKPKGMNDEEAVKSQLEIAKARLPALDPQIADMKNWGEFNPDGWRAYVKNILGIDPNKVNPADFYTNQLIPKANDFNQEAFRAFARNYVYKSK